VKANANTSKICSEVADMNRATLEHLQQTALGAGGLSMRLALENGDQDVINILNEIVEAQEVALQNITQSTRRILELCQNSN
jgi:hypothetical protein